MAKLSARDVLRLSAQYSGVAGHLTNYLISNYNELDDRERLELQLRATEVRDWSNKLALAATSLAKAEMGDAVVAIKEVTKEVDLKIKEIDSIGKVLGVVSALVSLAGSIIKVDLGAIVIGSEELVKAIG